jgi:hypothetical protein
MAFLDDAASAKDELEELHTSGFCSLVIRDEYRAWSVEHLLPLLRSKGETVRSGRTIFSVPLTKLSKEILEAMIPPTLLIILREYLRSPALIAVQQIVAPPRCVDQEIHRDFDLHAGMMLTWVVALNGAPLRTRFDPGSHSEAHKIIFRSSERTAALAQRAKRMVAPGQPSVVYDGFIMHAGGANPMDIPDDQRLFFVFADVSMDASELSYIKENNYVGAKSKHLAL